MICFWDTAIDENDDEDEDKDTRTEREKARNKIQGREMQKEIEKQITMDMKMQIHDADETNSSEVDPQEDQSDNKQQTNKTTHIAPATLFAVCVSHHHFQQQVQDHSIPSGTRLAQEARHSLSL